MGDYGSDKREQREKDRREVVDDLHDRHARDREDGGEQDGREDDGPDQVWIRGEGGALHIFDEPLPAGVAHRIRRGELARVNEDGSPWVPPKPDDGEDTAERREQMDEVRARTGIISGDNAVIGGQAAALPVPPVEVLPPGAGDLNTEPEGGSDEADEDVPEDAPKLPKRTASQKVWADFAVSQGMDREEAAGKTRDELAEEFSRERKAP